MEIKYKDKNNKTVKDDDYIYLEYENKVCQALRCNDGTLLYEELECNPKTNELYLSNEPNYPDSFEPCEIEIVDVDRAIELLKKIREEF